MSNEQIKHNDENILEVSHLKKYFPIKGGFFGGVTGQVKAVDDVSFNIKRGTTMGLVGESGCGKSTLGRTIIRLLDATDGTVRLNGKDITYAKGKELRKLREQVSIVFQDPYSSLNPRSSVESTIREPLQEAHRFSKAEINARTEELMDLVGIEERLRLAYPHEMDGGRRQRVGIARALALNPQFIMCDEPVSALDVSIQAQVINLLDDLRHKMGLTVLFIAHDLSVVKYFSDRIGVMYFGKLVELATSDELFAHPLHPYTRSLLSAIPMPDPDYEKQRRRITYVPLRDHDYTKEQPTLREVVPGHFVHCNQEEFDRYQLELKK